MEFCVIGRVLLGTAGSISVFSKALPNDVLPTERFPDLPKVVGMDYLHEQMEAKGKVGGLTSKMCRGGGAMIAEPDIPCFVCGKYWGLQNCWDCESVVDRDDKRVMFSGDEFVGVPSATIWKHIRDCKKDALYFVPVLEPSDPTRSIYGDSVICSGDCISLERWRMQHPACTLCGRPDIPHSRRASCVRQEAYRHRRNSRSLSPTVRFLLFQSHNETA